MWQAAIELAAAAYAMADKPAFEGHYSLKGQIGGAAVSISNNIAEGFEGGPGVGGLSFRGPRLGW